jgi:hypothetical protein
MYVRDTIDIRFDVNDLQINFHFVKLTLYRKDSALKNVILQTNDNHND